MSESTTIQVGQKFELAPGQLKQAIDDGVMLCDQESLHIHELNQSMAKIVEYAEAGLRAEEIVARFSAEFGLEFEQSAAEVFKGLSRLVDINVLCRVEAN